MKAKRRTTVIFTLAAALVAAAVLSMGQARTEAPEPAPQPAATPIALPAPSPPPASAGPVSVRVRLDQSVVPHDSREGMALVEVAASKDAERPRTPLAVAIVIDASSSMSGNKIANARRAAAQLVDRLHDGDLLSVVSFSFDATSHMTCRRLGADRAAARRIVQRVTAGGVTCISCGLEAAYRALAASPEGYRRRAVLISDGEATAGEQRPLALRTQAARGLVRRAVTTVGIGIGRGYDVRTMSAIAEGGAGPFYFVHNSSVIPKVLDRELRALRRTVAEGLALRLTPGPGVRLGRVHAAGARRDGKREWVVTLGDLTAGQRRRILVPLQLSAAASGAVLEARATLLLAGTGDRATVTASGTLTRSGDRARARASRDAAVHEEHLRLSTAREVDAAMTAYSDGRRDQAISRLRRQLTRLQRARRAGSRVAVTKVTEVREALELCQRHAPTSNQGIASARVARAKSYEVRRGLSTADLYHGVDPFDAAELE
jgi:Ca-activated chloride channel family protein